MVMDGLKAVPFNKVTSSQDDDFVERLKTWLGVQKARKDRKGHRLSG
jgi:hypothetical protein